MTSMKSDRQKIDNTLEARIDRVESKFNQEIYQIKGKIFASENKINDLDREIWRVQQSTKTLWKAFSSLHNWLREHNKFYYNWHLKPYANKIHWVSASLTLVIAIALSGYQLGFWGIRTSSQAAVGIPKMVNYQGKLTNLSNIPVTDGSYNFVIKIYDAVEAGSCLWTWKGTCGTPTTVPVTVSNGIYSVLLGDTSYQTTNALNLDFNSDTYYLGVTVGADAEMAPRKRIGAIGYAYNSDTVDGKHETDFVLDAGRSGGQTAYGGTDANDDLTLEGTSNETRTTSYVLINPDGGNTGIGESAPGQKLSVAGTLGIRETGDTPTKYTILQGGDQSIDLTYTLPTAYPGVSGYVLSSSDAGVMSWVAQSGSTWTDGGAYVYPTNRESMRVYDATGVDYIDIAHDGTDATISFATTTALNLNLGIIDLSVQTVDITLNAAVDALNFDSNTLSIDASNNRVGIGTAAPGAKLEVEIGATEGATGLLVDQQDLDQIAMTLGNAAGATTTLLNMPVNSVMGNAVQLYWNLATDATGNVAAFNIDLSNLTPLNNALNTAYGLHINDPIQNNDSTAYGLYIQGVNWDYGIYSEDDVYIKGSIIIANSGTANSIRFYENSGNGTNYSGLKAAATLSADTTWTLPTADGSTSQVLKTDGSAVLGWTDQPVNLVEGRLTLTTGVPVTVADVASSTDVFFTPYKGNRIALYNGSTGWDVLTFTQITMALGVVVSAKPYDVFAYNNSGAVAIEKLAWTNGTTRATALTLQDGVWVKNGDTTRRYLGTFYTISTAATADTAELRFLYNYYNRMPKRLYKFDNTNTWTYNTAVWRSSNNSTANRVQWILGITEDIAHLRFDMAGFNSGNNWQFVGIGINSTSVNSAATTVGSSASTAIVPYMAQWDAVPSVGYSYAQMLEWAGGATGNFYGDQGTVLMSAMQGWINN